MVRVVMATTTIEPTDRRSSTRPYAEHDKLGPLGSKRSVLDDDAELRRALVARVSGGGRRGARRGGRGRSQRRPTAVHEYRKALRRARAVLALVADALPKSERRAVARALREARRALGPLAITRSRPRRVSLLALGETSATTANAILGTRARGRAADRRDQAAARRGRRARRGAGRGARGRAARRRSRGRPSSAASATSTPRRAAPARRAQAQQALVPRWRRRSKELRYQLELLAGYAGLASAELAARARGRDRHAGPGGRPDHAARLRPDARHGHRAARRSTRLARRHRRRRSRI